MKVDGQSLGDVSYKYSVQSFPTFIYVQPNTKGLKAMVYRGDRTYDDMKTWMEEILGPPTAPSVPTTPPASPSRQAAEQVAEQKFHLD